MESVRQRRMDAVGVFSAIRGEIEDGQLKPHDRLPAERELAGRYSVSRGTVRRALAELAAFGLVEVRPGSGAYVAGAGGNSGGPSLENVRPLELIDVRFALEPHICRLAVLNAVKADFDELEELLTAMESETEDASAFAGHDTMFHAKLAEITGNQLLMWISAQANSVRGHPEWTRMRRLTLEPGIISNYNRQHRAIVGAIRARDPETAAQHMKDHLETARLSLTRASAT